MVLSQVLFWFLAILSVGAALGVILSKNPIHSILWLIVVFFSISGHYVLMNAQFLAVVNIIVYAGAIMVLFLFVVMFMNLNSKTEPPKRIFLKMAGIISGLCIMLVLIAAFSDASIHYGRMRPNTDIGLVETLGNVLFTQYVIPFEISSVLFLSAMVGAIVIGKRDPIEEGTISIENDNAEFKI